jgi:DNA gyrase inhibitor GyrI
MKNRWKIIVVVIGIILISAIAVGSIMSRVETPAYEVIKSQGKIEIRQFEPMIIAEVQMQGERTDAISKGFRLLADYIFGNNTMRQNIAMTAPVRQRESTQIAMIAPMQQQSTKDSWLVSFVMPSEYSMESLPKPKNDRVTLKKVPPQQFIVITFSGTSSDENLREHEEELIEFIKTNNISVTGTSKYAFYNPPWTLPLMRRNEVMTEMQ